MPRKNTSFPKAPVAEEESVASSLATFSRSIDEQANRRQLEHQRFNLQIAEREPVFFDEYPDTNGHGMGWFRVDGGFVGYRKFSNGYDPYSRQVIEDDFLRKLIPHVPPAPAAPVEQPGGRYDGG